MKTVLLNIHMFNDPITINPAENWPEGEYQVQYDSSNQIALFSIPAPQIFTDYLEGYLKADLIIFASKHSSAAGKKAILVHTTGNWAVSSIGSGSNHSIAYAPAFALSYGYHTLKQIAIEHNLEEYWIGLECTHHGPSDLSIPVIFMEAGGTQEEWEDMQAIEVVSESILSVAKVYLEGFQENKTTIIGIGGGHYVPSFLKRLDREMFYVGHMIPKHHHSEIDESMLQQAYKKTIADDKLFLIDKKGTRGRDRQRFKIILDKLGYKWALTTDFPTDKQK